MRGVVSGANENHSGSQPSVGTYLDEQPVTTIDGTPDVHLYDIQRIEVLEGPQGTLYGASSQAGTVRIITNKPDPTKFSASYDVQMNRVGHGGTGDDAEAYATWSVTHSAMVQSLAAEGFFGYDTAVGYLKVAHFGPESSDDTLSQTALTVEGKFSNFDFTHAGAFMKRTTHSIADYSDYSEFYDRVFGSGYYWNDAAGKPIMPQEIVVSKGYFQNWSHEVRLSTPQDIPVQETVGL